MMIMMMEHWLPSERSLMLEIETVSEMLNFCSKLTRLIVREDLIILVALKSSGLK
jgi:hypothetical protein